MNKICYATYDENFKNLALKICHELNIDIDIHIWGEHDLDYYDQIKVIIARGRTANIIKNTLNIPVVEVPISIKDIIDAIVKASNLGRKIAIVGYDNIMEDIDKLNPISNIEIYQRFAQDEEDTYRQIVDLKNNGIDVIIGGSAQYRIAKNMGLQSVRLDLTHQAIKDAYQEANSILMSIENIELKNKNLSIILDNTTDAYIMVDKSNTISMVNKKVCSIKKIINPNDIIGKNLYTIFPELNLQNNQKKLIKINSSEFLYNEIILQKNNNIILEKIIQLTPIDDVEKADYQIRKNIINNGFKAKYNFSDIVGLSDSMEVTKNTAMKFAKTNSTILITGNTGVGKELFAQSIHNFSLRKNEPFVAINCGALPESLLESELFGYDKGAFTGADSNGKKGAFEIANKGTIFLDEISELPLKLQATFLRVLQEKQIVRLSSNKVRHVDIRVIAASNKNLKNLVREGLFREDLFYRLNVLPIIIPDLKNRTSDIDELINIFWSKITSDKPLNITSKAYNILLNYSWPGNVRQLENFIERLSIISDHKDIITSKYIEDILLNYEPLDEIEKVNLFHDISHEEIDEVLEFHNNNKSKAANSLKIHRSTLWRIKK